MDRGEEKEEELTTATILLGEISSSNNNNDYDNYNMSAEAFDLPPDMVFNETHLMVICCYSIVFLYAALGNITMLLILLRNLRKAKLNRVYTLLLNLNVADLIVTFFHMPKEIIHSATVQWYGPDWLCRVSKYLDVFGIYLSSNVLICLSIDRFFAIVRPLYSFTAGRRVRVMIIISWIVAAASSLPQVYTFCKATHPAFTWYSQCIALPIICGTGNSTQYVLFNTALNALEIYILPFVVIVVCYGTILANMLNEFRYASEASASRTGGGGGNSAKLSLRRSSYCYIRRAKSKTLRMTIVIVVTFLICWSPYFVMVSLHFADLNLATGGRYYNIKLPAIAEKFLYIFAIFNSCINPYLYGYYSFKLKPELEALLDCLGYYCCCGYAWCPRSTKLRAQERRSRRRTMPSSSRMSTVRRNNNNHTSTSGGGKSNNLGRGLSLDMGTTGGGGDGNELTIVEDNFAAAMTTNTTKKASPQPSAAATAMVATAAVLFSPSNATSTAGTTTTTNTDLDSPSLSSPRTKGRGGRRTIPTSGSGGSRSSSRSSSKKKQQPPIIVVKQKKQKEKQQQLPLLYVNNKDIRRDQQDQRRRDSYESITSE